MKKEQSYIILSSSSGAGHIKAAEALEQVARLVNRSIRTAHYDVLDMTTPTFKRLYAQSYLEIVNRAPELWGYLYQMSEAKPAKKNSLVKAFDKMLYKRYLNMLNTAKPDAIICTHFLPYISISQELRKLKPRPLVVVSTTDFDIHRLWIDPVVDRYYVYHEESAWQLQSKGVAADRIRVKGIPVIPQFAEPMEKRAARKVLGLHPESFTILVLSGGFGVGRVEDIVIETARTLASFTEQRFNLVVVCGKNDRLKKQLEIAKFSANVAPHISGFVGNVYDYMAAADVLISKSGGLTSSEAMARTLPMIIIDPIPGQESRNADLIVEHGAGWRAINLANLSFKLSNVIKHPRLLERARLASKRIAKPHAAEEIIKDVYKMVQNARLLKNDPKTE